MSYKCPRCNIITAINPKDTLLYTEARNKNSTYMFSSILQYAHKDPVAEKKIKKCKRSGCENTIMNTVRIGDEMKLIYVCTVCKNSYIHT